MTAIDIAAEALIGSRHHVLIPTGNPLFPLVLDIAVLPGDHIAMTLTDGIGAPIWSRTLIPRGGGEVLAAMAEMGDDDG